MKIFIATPVAGGVVKTGYVSTIASTIMNLSKKGIECRYSTVENSDVVNARNHLASSFLEDETCTHLFFVDSDMSFRGELCARMLSFDKPVVGCVYTKRQLDWKRLQQNISAKNRNVEDALTLSYDYNVVVTAGQRQVVNGLLKVNGFGMGAALISREAFQLLVNRKVCKVKRNDKLTKSFGLKKGWYDFFDLVYTGSEYLSEDYSFCKKWSVDCGQDLFALVDEDIQHIGEMRYGRPYLKRLLLQTEGA